MKKAVVFWAHLLILWGALIYGFSVMNNETIEGNFVTVTFGVLYLMFVILILCREKEIHGSDFLFKSEKWYGLTMTLSMLAIFGMWYLEVEFLPLVLFGVGFTMFYNRTVALATLLFFVGILTITGDSSWMFIFSIGPLSAVLGCYLGEFLREKKNFLSLTLSISLIHGAAYALYSKEYHLTMELTYVLLHYTICFAGISLLYSVILIKERFKKVIPWEKMAEEELEKINKKKQSNPDFFEKVLARTKVAMEMAEEFEIDKQKIRYLSYHYEKEELENHKSLEFMIVHLLDNYIQIRNFLQMKNNGKKVESWDIVQFVFEKKERGDFFKNMEISLEDYLRLKQLLEEKGGRL